MLMGHAVGPGRELRDIAYRGHAVGTDISADVHPDIAAQTKDGAIHAKRDLKIAFGLARVANCHKMLAAVLNPFHRAAELAGGKGDQKILRIEFAARAKTATDVVLDIVDGLLGKSHHP